MSEAPRNPLQDRLEGLRQQLVGAYRCGVSTSSASKGFEREILINALLQRAFPTIYRFGSGDIIDQQGNHSGQVDIVMEYPFTPAVPDAFPSSAPRLYLAESVAAVIEVKSDLGKQWRQVCDKAEKLKGLHREFKSAVRRECSYVAAKRIPLIAVGYTGWNQLDALQKPLEEDVADAILVIDPGVFVCRREYGQLEAEGAWALWGLVCCLHLIGYALAGADVSPYHYIPKPSSAAPESPTMRIRQNANTNTPEKM